MLVLFGILSYYQFHAEVIAKRLNIPLYRQGIPIFDRLGNAHSTKIGYRGTMQQLFDIANLFIKN